MRTTGASIDELLAAFERAKAPESRARIGLALATAGVRDDRIRAALVGMLESDPLHGAACLSALGDRSAVGDLSTALDRLVASPLGDCEICQAEHLVAIASAARVLGGDDSLSLEQLRNVEAAMDRATKHWIPLDGHCSSGPPTPLLRRRHGRRDGGGIARRLEGCRVDAGAPSGADRDEEDPLH